MPFPNFALPLFPLVPAASLLFNVFLMSSLPGMAFAHYAAFLAAALLVYLLYGMQAREAFRQHNAAKQQALLPAASHE